MFIPSPSSSFGRNRRALLTTLFLTGLAFAPVASAAIFSVDLTSSTGGDAYNTGEGAFGDASTRWNELSRSASADNVSLLDETGAASTVKVSYTRNGSGFITIPTGQYAALEASVISTGPVTISGLIPGLAYDLAVYGTWSGTPSITVGAVTKFFPALNPDWSTLTEGTQYFLFHPVADETGNVIFTPNTNPTGVGALKIWSAFQIQPTPVPEPHEYALVSGLSLLGVAVWRRTRRASPASPTA